MIVFEFNGQKWGKMNFEPIIDKYALELSEKKESLVLKFDNQKEWNYRILNTKNGTYVPEYKAFDMLFDAKKRVFAHPALNWLNIHIYYITLKTNKQSFSPKINSVKRLCLAKSGTRRTL